ncbi:hypothetical protein BH11ARM1_BH11ARM1_00120 [soil metagenome]
MIEILSAQPQHFAEMAEIENWEIDHGFAHFGMTHVTEGDLAMAYRPAEYPWFVAVDAEQVVGYCKAGPWKPREAYRRTCEIGIYLRASHEGKGIAKRLYGALIPALRDLGFVAVNAGIALPNPASVYLHESIGMQPVGVFRKNGFKMGEWRDTEYWQMIIEENCGTTT